MPANEDTPRPRRMLSKGRMEGFSDGVLGFAITLLVLDLALRPPGTPLQQVLHAWPSYLAYLISFLTIGGAWLAHTGLTDQLERIDPVILRLNLLVLLAVTFLPFPTRLTAALHNTSGERVFVTMFGSRSWRSAFWGPPWMPTRGPSTSLLGRTKPTRNCTETGGTFCHSSSGM